MSNTAYMNQFPLDYRSTAENVCQWYALPAGVRASAKRMLRKATRLADKQGIRAVKHN